MIRMKAIAKVRRVLLASGRGRDVLRRKLSMILAIVLAIFAASPNLGYAQGRSGGFHGGGFHGGFGFRGGGFGFRGGGWGFRGGGWGWGPGWVWVPGRGWIWR